MPRNKDRIRSFHITFRVSSVEAKSIDRKLDTLQNEYFSGEKSRNQILQWLLRDAIDLHYEKFREGQGPTKSIKYDVGQLPDPVLVENLAQEVELRQEIHDNLGRIYETEGLDGFVEICEAHGIDWQAFLEHDYTLTAATEMTWTDRARSWLVQHLADGDLHATGDVREAAEEDGLCESDKDWSKLRTIAAREEFTQNAPRGYWARSPHQYTQI